MCCSYTVIPVVRTPVIDPGETIEIALFITGHGTISRDKLYINYQHPNLIDPADVGQAEIFVRPAHSDGMEFAMYGETQSFDLPTGGWTASIGPMLYPRRLADRWMSNQDKIDTSNFKLDLFQDEDPAKYPNVCGESSYGHIAGELEFGRPPILIKINTRSGSGLSILSGNKEMAEPGQYPIHISYTYGDSNDVNIHDKEVQIKVRSWVERHSKILRILAVIIGLISILPYTINGIEVLYDVIELILIEYLSSDG